MKNARVIAQIVYVYKQKASTTLFTASPFTGERIDMNNSAHLLELRIQQFFKDNYDIH